jgi:uncharacterized membrane protein
MNPTDPAPEPTAIPVNEDKTIAIISYLTIIGFIIAVIMHGSNKTRLGAYHLRQMLGLLVTGVVLFFVGLLLAFIPLLGWLTSMALWFGLFVLWLIGLIAAANGQMKPVPVLGQQYEQWFGKAFE